MKKDKSPRKKFAKTLKPIVTTRSKSKSNVLLKKANTLSSQKINDQ